MNKKHQHRYWLEEQAGRHAKPGAECPYHDLGRRCAWLAGYRDTRSKSSDCVIQVTMDTPGGADHER